MNIVVDDVCDADLVLGLGRWDPSPIKLKQPSSSPKLPDPSLTLGLSDAYMPSATAQPPSPNRTINSSIHVKGENDAGSEEAERGVSSRTSDDEEEGGVRKKLRLTKEQSALLEDEFRAHPALNPKQKLALANQLNLRPRQVEVWFQNRRARTKLKQTEVDREALKRCCESLSDENRRLQTELEELRGFKVYMQPAAIAVCPSCEQVVGPAVLGETGKAGAFIAAPTKAQFFNPFVRSAAC